MNLRDLSDSWISFHHASRLGERIQDEAHYEEVLRVTEALMDQLPDEADSPIFGLLELVTDRIQEYEAREHPWPDKATPAQVLEFLMDQHGLKQGDLEEIGSQGVVSEILRGKRELNVRQITRLAERFHVSPASFFPAARSHQHEPA